MSFYWKVCNILHFSYISAATSHQSRQPQVDDTSHCNTPNIGNLYVHVMSYFTLSLN